MIGDTHPAALPKPFQIGLRPLDPEEWIVVDARLPEYLDEKVRLEREQPAAVFAAEAGTEAAQAEVLALLVVHLPACYPETYRREGDRMVIVPVGRSVELAGGDAPLRVAARLVQEDLVLMRRGEAGWRLAAASLSFPSAWQLAEKFGRPIHEVHGPVPGFGAGTRQAQLIERMFDNARPETPMLRWNWSLFGDARLFHPEGGHPGVPRFGAAGERAHFRLERQTLRKLAGSGDLLFTIRIFVDPLAALAGRPELVAALLAQLGELSESQLDYKGLWREREVLAAQLKALLG